VYDKRAYDRKYYQRHRREWRARQRRYYRQHRGKWQAYGRRYGVRYYQQHREKLLKQSHDYYCRCRKPMAQRAYDLLHTYGMTMRQYAALLRRARYACAICKTPFTKTPHVDHNHETGQCRGALCGSCNRGLGAFKDNLGRLEAAAAYLRRYSGDNKVKRGASRAIAKKRRN
jgi:5-methylcytosine-specific restriction endonuclease McrA